MPENLAYVVGAYGVMWAVIIGYLLRLRSLTNRSRAALEHARLKGGRS